MNEIQKFWMVYNISGTGFSQKMYATIDDAQQEANRLARHHMGNTIVVLEAVAAYTAMPPVPIQVKVVKAYIDGQPTCTGREA